MKLTIFPVNKKSIPSQQNNKTNKSTNPINNVIHISMEIPPRMKTNIKHNTIQHKKNHFQSNNYILFNCASSHCKEQKS